MKTRKLNFYLLIFTVLIINQLCYALDDNSKKPFVTCSLNGQLGNQLHQIATTLAYAWDNDVDPIFPDLNNTDLNIFINSKRIFFRLNSSSLPRCPLNLFEQYEHFEKIPIPVLPDQHLLGFFQTWEYYHHHRNKLIEIFAPSPEEFNYLKLKYQDLLNHPCTVGVHVRTFNEKWSKTIPFVGLDYYEKAFDIFPSEALFIVFSDRINWCKHHFDKFKRSIIFIETNDHIEDFFLMSLLKHNIIANSSYSWWAAYLNQNPQKIVIAPSHFVHPLVKPKYRATLPEWIILNIDFNYQLAPYPCDIDWYDTISQSLDTQ